MHKSLLLLSRWAAALQFFLNSKSQTRGSPPKSYPVFTNLVSSGPTFVVSDIFEKRGKNLKKDHNWRIFAWEFCLFFLIFEINMEKWSTVSGTLDPMWQNLHKVPMHGGFWNLQSEKRERERKEEQSRSWEGGTSGSSEWMIELCRGGISREWPKGKGKQAETTGFYVLQNSWLSAILQQLQGAGRTKNVEGPELQEHHATRWHSPEHLALLGIYKYLCWKY